MGDSSMSASELRNRYHQGGSAGDADLSASQLRARYGIASNRAGAYNGVLQLFASLLFASLLFALLSIDFSRRASETRVPRRRLLDGLQGPAEHGHGRRGRRRRRAARALLLARRVVRGTGADRADARVIYWTGRVVVWKHVWRLGAGRRASVAAAARSGGVESRERGSATRRPARNKSGTAADPSARRRGDSRAPRTRTDDAYGSRRVRVRWFSSCAQRDQIRAAHGPVRRTAARRTRVLHRRAKSRVAHKRLAADSSRPLTRGQAGQPQRPPAARKGCPAPPKRWPSSQQLEPRAPRPSRGAPGCRPVHLMSCWHRAVPSANNPVGNP